MPLVSAWSAAQFTTVCADGLALTAAFDGLPSIPTALSDHTNDVGYTPF